MSDVSGQEVSNPAYPSFPPASANLLGDVVCAHCRLQFITPRGAAVQPGLLRCWKCGRISEVTRQVAETCNSRAADQCFRH